MERVVLQFSESRYINVLCDDGVHPLTMTLANTVSSITLMSAVYVYIEFGVSYQYQEQVRME